MKKYNIKVTACGVELNTLSSIPTSFTISKSFIIEAKDKEDAKQKGLEKFIADTFYKGSIYGEYTGERCVAPFMEGFADDHSGKYEDITRNDYYVYRWQINVFVKQYRKPRTKPEAEATAETTEATAETTEATAETTEATAETTETTAQTTETTEATAQTTEATETTEATAQTTEATETTEAMSITLTINMDENNELLETIKAYKIEADLLRQTVAKALKAEAEARAEVRKLKKTIEDYKSIIEALQATAPPTGATAQTAEATAEITEETAQTAEATTQHTEETAQPAEVTEQTAETAEETPPPTETTGQPTDVTTTEATPPPIISTRKEVTGVTIIEHRQYNNGDKIIIKHNCFYNADEIIDNYHATDPSYICKYKGLMFGKDDNDYYVSEFHYEEQYL